MALELAAVWMPTDEARRLLVQAYADIASIPEALLQKQVRRWRPWVLMLMAGWFELRYQQTGDKQFITLADDVWRQLQTKG